MDWLKVPTSCFLFAVDVYSSCGDICGAVRGC